MIAERPNIHEGDGALIQTYSHYVPITIVQALVVSMLVALDAEICHPQLRCFEKYWSGVLCEWVKR
jgi:hypothetical protein